MKIILDSDNYNRSIPIIPEGTIIAETLLRILKYNELNNLYTRCINKDPDTLIDALIEQLDLKYEVSDEEMKNIPEEGPFITISNHPYRGIDSMLLMKLIRKKRPDFKIIASHLLHDLEPLRDLIIPVNTSNKSRSSYSGIKEAINHLRNGGCIGIFPTGEVSSTYEVSKVILDKEWHIPALKLIKKAGVPAIPVYFHGTNSRLVHIVEKIHPLLRTSKLPNELIRNKLIKIRIGTAITVKEQTGFSDISQFGRYLRARTYSLGTPLEARKFFNKPLRRRLKKKEAIADPVRPDILEKEFNRVRDDFELFSVKNFSVVCAPTMQIPNIFNEIGRLREVTFREVGEGTNKSTDIDEYDFYYYHLFIWDKDEKMIVGAYRIGKGIDIYETYGSKGFYISSLFKMKREMNPILIQSLELGRSFITKDYQKRPIPLFLLWKGIMIFLIRNTEYRYLIGPVSISNDFSKFSKSLIVEFIRAYFTDENLSRYVLPRKDFKVKDDIVTDRKIFIDTSEKDINKIEKIILNIEPRYRLPVLLKKYLELNGRIIGFNVDPKFNDCLDGLLVLDLYNIPPDFLRGLSKEVNDDSIMNRFKL